MIQTFFRFLKDKNIYEEYMFYVKNREFWDKNSVKQTLSRQRYKTSNDFISSTVKKRIVISGAFAWNYTKEGYDFWNNIYLEWQKYI